MKRLAKLFKELEPKTILDVGTGSGNFISLIQKVYDDYNDIIGIDQLPIAIKTAEEYFQDERIHFSVMNGDDLLFEDNHFDVVTLSNALHHMSHYKAVLKEIKRVLKPNGVFIVSEMIQDDLDKRQIGHLKLHEFAAEVDRLRGEIHGDTFYENDVLMILEEDPSFHIESSWRLFYEKLRGNSEQNIEYMCDTVDQLIEMIKLEDKEPYVLKGESIKKYIRRYGFDSCTSLIVVMKK